MSRDLGQEMQRNFNMMGLGCLITLAPAIIFVALVVILGVIGLVNGGR